MDELLEELNRLWQGRHPEDTRFAKWWAAAVIKHTDARAREGHFEQIGKTLEALRDFSAKFPGNAEFAGYGSMLALNALKRAADAGEFSIAEEMFDTLQEFAQGLSGEQGSVANYAEGALALCIAYQNRGQMKESKRAPRAAAWALRSKAWRQRHVERGGEESMEELLNWLDAIGATNG